MITPKEIQKIRDVADLLTGSDRPRLAESIRDAATELEGKAAKTAREDAAKLQAAADVIRARFGAGSLEDANRKLANEILAPFEGIVEEKAGNETVVDSLVGGAFPMEFAGMKPDGLLTHIDANGFRKAGDGPTVVTLPLGSGIWPPERAQNESFKIRREGFDRGVRECVALLRMGSGTSKDIRAYAKAADLLDARLPGSTAKR